MTDKQQPKRVSLPELMEFVGCDEEGIEEAVRELNAMVPAEVLRDYGPDYKLVTLHTDPHTQERYALLHAQIKLK